MLFKNRMAKKASERPAAAEPNPEVPSAAHEELHLEALEQCVGGRSDSQGVGCYLQSTPSQAH
jgi:hypothetical protein